MNGWTAVFVCTAIPLFAGAVPVFLCIVAWDRRIARESRCSPLTRSLLRSPGHTLRIKIDELREYCEGLMLAVLVLPFLICVTHISQSHFVGTPETLPRVLIELAILAGISSLLWFQLKPKLEALRTFRLGLEGELSTGQELDQLMLCGCRVFHDIEFPYGNIDHVVISRSGLFTVETKMRGKPKEGEGCADAVVDYDRNEIRFPDFLWPIPTKQPETQANWLSKHLSAAMGERIEAEPIIALPGWFIRERIGRGRVLVLNPLNAHKFFVNSREVFSEQRVSQLAHHLEQLCRDVKPTHVERE